MSDMLKRYPKWKMSAPFQYDLVVTHALRWPSLTVEWLPDLEERQGGDYSVQKMIIGTKARIHLDNYLFLAQVQLPIGEGGGVDSKGDFSSSGGIVRIVQQMRHDGKVKRARYMPQNPSIIATKTISSQIFLFDCSKYPPEGYMHGLCNPDLRLTGHSDKGYPLSWSPFKQGHLLSGSKDGQFCMWDVNSTPTFKTLKAMHIFSIHDGCVEDVAWHTKHENLFGSVGEDKYLCIWDMRTPVIRPNQSVLAHSDEVKSLAFNPFNEWVVATGSADKKVKLFDLRKISSALHTLEWPAQEEVAHVRWNPKHETILASSCAGKRLVVWDLCRIGQEQTQQDAKVGPPELLFLHGGHTNRITDFSWNPCDEWVVASTAIDNLLHIWQMAEHIYDKDDDDFPGFHASQTSHSKSPKQMDP
nr:WD-40 repeat-containing protein MSI1 [Ipomoea trifida]